MTRKLTAIFIISIAGLCLLQCLDKKKEIRLEIKYRPGLQLEWRCRLHETGTRYENGAPVREIDNGREYTMVEKVLDMVDSVTARLRSTSYYTAYRTDPADSSRTINYPDSVVYVYLQDNRGCCRFRAEDNPGLGTRMEYLERINEQLAPMYPKENVGEGFTWNNRVRILLAEDAVTELVTTYRVRSFVREAGYDCLVIEYEGTTIVPFQSTPDSPAPTAVGLDRSTFKGVYYFAYRKGFIVKLNENYEFETEGTRFAEDGKTDYIIKKKGVFSYSLIKADGA